MKAISYFKLIITLVFVLFASCNKSTICSTEESFVECGREIDIATVKAKIQFIQNPDDECPWALYELASVKYDNDFKLDELIFPETLPDNYLLSFSEKEKNTVSDGQAQTATVSIYAYNSAGKGLGFINIVVGNESCEYGTNNINEFDCSYEKGWNIVYTKYDRIIKHITQKPLDEDFHWYFSNICLD